MILEKIQMSEVLWIMLNLQIFEQWCANYIFYCNFKKCVQTSMSRVPQFYSFFVSLIHSS